jgi:uridine monophosphate synthetase
MHMGFFQKLEERSAGIKSLLCVGLDPRHAIQPGSDAAESLTGMIEENKRIIEATADLALAYKPNIAFYEALGAPGIQALEVTLELIPDEIPVILDAKRGDIGATALAYAQAAFGLHDVDAITLSPYMGKDSIEPFIKDPRRGAFLLCRTSNPGGADLQLLEDAGGRPLFLNVADLAASWGKNVGLVVAGNDIEALRAIREEHGDVWFLSPGIGAQGGSMEDAVAAGINDRGSGILPVVARGISQADDPGRAARKFVDELNAAREKALSGRRSAGNGVVSGAVSGENALRSADPLKQRVLGGLIDAECFKTGEFTLKSGEKSPFYIDLRRVMSYPSLMRDVARAYARLIRELQAEGEEFDAIAGIPVAGLPLSQAASLETGIPMVFPRMNAKSHGTGNTVEGRWKPGDRVLLLDDLITSGKSKIEALEILRGAGLKVDKLVVLIERGARGRKDMEEAGVDLRSFAEIHEFLPLCQDRGLISVEQRTEMEDYARS